MERGIGWLKHGRRVATRYDKYAHHFLGFLYLAGAWIWLKSHINRTQYHTMPQEGGEGLVSSGLRLGILVCLTVYAHLWAAPVRAATSDSALDIPPALFFAPQPRIRLPFGETPRLGDRLNPSLPVAQRAYRVPPWRWRRADSAQPAPQDVEATQHYGRGGFWHVVQANDMGRFLSACIQIAVAPDIVPWYCTDFVGPATNPVPDSMLDIPPALALGPQPTWIRRDFNLGKNIAVSLPPPQNAYSVSGWRWRRADSAQPALQDIETVARGPSSYRVQADDAGRFLSACIHIAVAPDIASEYCTDFAGPVANPNLTCASFKPPSPVTRGRWRLVPALDGCRWNWLVNIVPGPDGGWFIVERLGRILHHRPGSATRLLLDLTAEVGRLTSENGLLNFGLDPQFPTRPFIYVYYTRWTDIGELTARLSRFPVAEDRMRREAELILLETPPRLSSLHFGGGLGFGPDNLLYLGVGDRQAPAQAQRPGSLLGKILRLDVRCGAPGRAYCIPAANPWRGQAAARPEVYARGFRNPWRLALDPQDGTLWVADVGHTAREEVNRVQAGGNHGWPLWEGDLCRTGPVACAEIAHAPPVALYAHDAQGGCAVIGGVVYRGAALPGLDGAYLFGDYCSGRVWALAPRVGGGWRMRQLIQMPPGLRLLAFVAHGDAIYLLTADGPDSVVLQLVPA